MLCSELTRSGIVAFQTGFTHASFLIVFQKIPEGWLLIQNLPFHYDAKFSLSSNGALRIDEDMGTSHEIWRWNGNAFHPWKEWSTVRVWNGKDYVSVRLTNRGDLPDASPECSVSAAHKAIVAVDASDAEYPREPDQEKRRWPLSRLRCIEFADGGGSAMLFALANWPSVGDEPWYLVRRTPEGRWQWLADDPEWECLEAIDSGGFTTSHLLLSVEHPAGCPESGPCVRHDEWRWKGKDFSLARTWFTGHREATPVVPCNE
ncbi:MAG: hypothetical protein ACLQAT_17100 [Candidatus Binataceae bacterium]